MATCMSSRRHILDKPTDRGHSTPVDEPDKPESSSTTKCTTPNKQSASKSAVASLRQNLSHHSRHSGRGSVSNIFRRSGSHASSLRVRGPRDPEAIIRNSQDMSKATSPLAKDGNNGKDSAALVPLPSSPINIPPPAPTLRLDLGPPTMLSPFMMTSADIAEIKVLQDPTNITAGIPPSCPLDWQDRAVPVQRRRRAFVADSESPSTDGKHRHCPGIVEVSTGKNDNTYRHRVSAMASVGPPPFAKLHSRLEHHDPCLSDSAARLAQYDDPFGDPPPTPKGLQPPIAMIDEAADGTRKPIPEYTEARKSFMDRVVGSVPSVADRVNTNTPNNPVALCHGDDDDPIDEFELPSPLFTTETLSSQSVSHATEHSDHTKLMVTPVDAHKASTDAKVIRARHKYRDSLAGLEECTAIEELEHKITQHVEQNPFVGGPGLPSRAMKRSDSLVPDLSGSPEDDFAMPEIPGNIPATPEPAKSAPVQKSGDRKDSLFEDTNHVEVHEHGPPSPERCVRLPLRPKPTLTKHTSFESTIFKPILDRVAAKNLGVFRPGSDPLLRQKYFSRGIVGTNSPVENPIQAPLDLDDTHSTETELGDTVGIFERTVEQPSPLHIRKQSSTTPTHTVPAPQTLVSISTPEAPGSSPIRTPSMGDRQQFDLQRAERNARYNSIHSDTRDTMLDHGSDLQLAEFGNAGPGSKGLTPKRSSGGGKDDGCQTPTFLKCGLSKVPGPRVIEPGVLETFLALSKD